MEKIKSYFWLRIASTVIDLSIIYCISILLRIVIFNFTFARLCDIYVSVFFVYYAASYFLLKGRSPAKLLTGLKIIQADGGDIHLKSILIREVGLKLFLGIILPSYFLQYILPVWSPFYTLALELIIIILSFILLLIFRKSWWDLYSQTRIIKTPFTQRATKNYTFLSITLIIIVTLILIINPFYKDLSKIYTTIYPEYPVTAETIRYADFIKHKTQDPTEYVFDLFKKYDLVVISERYHEEYSQYELFKKIIKDERFIKNVGNIFTETGSVSFQDTINTYLHTKFKNEDELNKSTAILQRNSNSRWPIWNCTNHFDLLKFVNKLNIHLPDSSKINWYYSDIPVNWEKMTKANYLKGFTPLKRDSVMAINIINHYKNNVLKGRRKKTLLILNTNHGYGNLNHQTATGIGWVDSATTNYLRKALPGRVANVMMNTTTIIFTPIQNGKWETAFKIAGNREAGFNFKGSPFGDDRWDGFFLTPRSFTYKDVFTGYIFYKPLSQQYKEEGYPYEFVNFQDSLLRRASCKDQQEVKKSQMFINAYNLNPNNMVERRPAPYGMFINTLNVKFFPVLIILSYLLSLIYFIKRK